MRIVAIIATNCIFAEMESSMKNNVAIKVKNVGMRFNLSQDRVDNLKEYMIRFLKRDLHFNEFWALREINFEVKKGERLGVLGLNGSGKSTLLKIVSGVLKPTTGYVQTKGKLATTVYARKAITATHARDFKIFLTISLISFRICLFIDNRKTIS